MGKYDKRARWLLIVLVIGLPVILATLIYSGVHNKLNEPICEYPSSVEVDCTSYETQVVKGAIVQSLLNTYADCNIAVEVTTENGDYWYYYTDETLQEESNLDVSSSFKAANENYIEPTTEYYVSLTRDNNDNVVVVSFTQLEDDNAN